MSCPFCHNESSTLTPAAMFCLPSASLKARGSTAVNFERPSYQQSTDSILMMRKQAAAKTAIRGPPKFSEISAASSNNYPVYPGQRVLGYPYYHGLTRQNCLSYYEAAYLKGGNSK